MALLGYIIVALLMVQLIIAYMNILAGPQLSQGSAVLEPVRVSVLIPARNEAENIGRCLEGLLRQDYAPMEILVLDDHSEDHTAAIVARYAASHPNLRWFRGRDVPPGWTGKNWACHQLSELAMGDLMIFTDADNWHAPEAVRRTVGWMQQRELGLFSAFPQQVTRTLPEQLLVPMIDVLLYSILPLRAVSAFPAPSLSAANGQWLAWTAAAYRSLGGHRTVRHEVVEDVELARQAKQAGIRMVTAAGTGVVFARMYRSVRDIREGLAKVLFGLAGYHGSIFWAAQAVTFSLGMMPYILVWIPAFTAPAGLAIVLNGLVRGGLALRYRHPVVLSLFLHPVAVLLMLLLGVDSYRWTKKGVVRWKGREIVLSSH